MIAFLNALTEFLKLSSRLLRLYEPILRAKAIEEGFFNDIDKAAKALEGDGIDVAAEFARTELELLSQGLLPVDSKSWGSTEASGRSLRGDGGMDGTPTKD